MREEQPPPGAAIENRLGNEPWGWIAGTAIAKCVERAAQDLHYQSGERPEAVLVRAVRRALAQDGHMRLVDGEPRYALPGWTRPPGGVDVAADLADGTGRLAIETKVGKPEVSIWDAIKLADIQVFEPRVRAGYWCPTPTGPPALALAAPGDIIRIVQMPFRALRPRAPLRHLRIRRPTTTGATATSPLLARSGG